MVNNLNVEISMTIFLQQLSTAHLSYYLQKETSNHVADMHNDNIQSLDLIAKVHIKYQ